MSTRSQGTSAPSYKVPGAWPGDEETLQADTHPRPATRYAGEPPTYDEATNGQLAYTIVGYKAILLATTKVPAARVVIERIEKQYALCPPNRLEVFVRVAQGKLNTIALTLIRILQLLAIVKQRCEDEDVTMRVNTLLHQVMAMQPSITRLQDQLSRDKEMFRAVRVL